MAYFGEASQALPYFAGRGLECTLHYNPADYMCMSVNLMGSCVACDVSLFAVVEMVTLNESRKLLIGEDPVQDIAPQRLVSSVGGVVK